MKNSILLKKLRMMFAIAILALSSSVITAQTNVYDDIIATSPNHTSLAAAISTAGLESALQDDAASLTVFAPDNDAFDALATALGTDIAGLLALDNLSDILLYHVLGISAASTDISNGDIVTPLNDANTIKITKTAMGMVYVNQAMVNAADLAADNGYVHSIDAVILSNETVADIAIDNDFTSLTAALVTAELLPAVTNPFADLTVFAPDNDAFDNLATALGTDIDGLLALDNLSDILLYHVLGGSTLSTDITNGAIVTPLNDANTIKLTLTSGGMVYANQAMVTLADLTASNGVVHAIDAVILPNETVADIAIDNGFSSLTAAIVTAELLPAVTDPLADLTVFAPDNASFDNLATALGTDIDGLLALQNLPEILLYHVLAGSTLSTDITNGAIVTPLNDANTIKLTLTSGGMVYANQAMVTIADLTASNGVVHAIDAVILPNETVADIAIDNGFSSLTAALVTAELLPAVTDPLADLTVFAPDNTSFDNLATALGTDIDGLLALENLSDILLYHVLAGSTLSTDITNGALVTPLNDANTIKLTLTSGGMVYANQAMVTLADLTASNGVVHAIDAVILPNETVVDVAIDNDFTTLTAAVITAELLPALTDPLASFTVFAPTNEAFDDLAEALGTDLDGILALPILGDVLLYHVIGSEVLSTDLVNGPVTTLNGQDVLVDLTSGVMINDANVILADVTASNGVVHVIDAVLVPTATSVDELEANSVEVYPNPSADFINIKSTNGDINQVSLISVDGKILFIREIETNETRINLGDINPGRYILQIEGENSVIYKNIVKVSNY
jgi:transforming growth factor-beta-induced protein